MFKLYYFKGNLLKSCFLLVLVSLVMFIIIGLLVGSEIYNYSNSEVVYEYGVDSDTAS